MPDRSYSRLYHVFADEFPNVYDDDRALACWVRLLIGADAAWPTRPSVPADVNRKMLAVLQGADLVTVERGRYTVRGLDAERERRRAAAVTGGRARAKQMLSGPLTDSRAHRSPTAERNGDHPLSLDETRLDKTRVNETVREGAGARGLRPVDPTGETA